MNETKTPFALFFGNRGFFPSSMIASARTELTTHLRKWGHEVLLMDEAATRYGAVETPAEGEKYASFLHENRGKYGGVILCLPNFGDETGAVTALKEAGVPIFIQAYPDELDKMAPATRRDAFCGKLSIMDVFRQYGVKFTALKPHVVNGSSQAFRANIDTFDRLCRVVNGMRGLVVGAIGARTTPFKTVRIDELTLQKHGITVETLDLAEVIARVRSFNTASAQYRQKVQFLKEYTSWEAVSNEAFENLARLSLVLDEIIHEYRMDAIALRCWLELQNQLGISACVLLGILNEQGIPAACEVDTGNAVMMRALGLASGRATALLDWNNNYGDNEDQCILFHCGPVPVSLMRDKGRVSDHAILVNTLGEGRAFGCHVGRIAQIELSFGGLMTDEGKIKVYLGQGRITEDKVPPDFFGCAGVAEIDRLQDVLLHIGRAGHRHHVSITTGQFLEPLREALQHYLGFEVAVPQEKCQCH